MSKLQPCCVPEPYFHICWKKWTFDWAVRFSVPAIPKWSIAFWFWKFICKGGIYQKSLASSASDLDWVSLRLPKHFLLIFVLRNILGMTPDSSKFPVCIVVVVDRFRDVLKASKSQTRLPGKLSRKKSVVFLESKSGWFLPCKKKTVILRIRSFQCIKNTICSTFNAMS